jgi:crotonobetainyl-CoA:carnitine CoA-transferase CaiB-like acyl-CoA transferase
MTAEEALDDPDILTNGHAITLDDIRQLGPLARLSETPAQIQTPAPEPGQHNDLLDSVDPLTPNGTPEPTADAGPPLAGITILEFAGVLATPMGCSFLVDLGARVIKVEPLEGDPFRTITGESGASRVNNGKDSVTVNLKTEEGKAIVVELIKRADMIIHNYRPGVPEKLGIGYDDAKKINPGIVYLSANGYGPLGPSAMRPSAHPIPGAALGGAMYQAGGVSNTKLLDVAGLRETSRKLMRANEVNPDPNTGMVVCSAALLGLYGKRRSGIGQRVFIDMLGANAYANFDEFIQYEGKPTRPPLDSELRGPTPLYRLYRCKEGWIFLGLLLDREWEEFCRAIEREDLLQDPNFASEEMREDNRTLLSSKLADLFSAKTAVEWESLVGTRGLGCVAANNETPPEYFLKDAHVRENNWMVPANHALWGDYLRHAPMVEFSRSSCPVSGGVLAGQQTDAVMGELGFSSSDIVSLRDKNVLGPTVDAQRNHYQIL